jgi:hypothetical protein
LVEAMVASTVSAAQLMFAPQLLLWASLLLLRAWLLLLWAPLLLLWARQLMLWTSLLPLLAVPMASLFAKSSLEGVGLTNVRKFDKFGANIHFKNIHTAAKIFLPFRILT